MSLKLNNTQTNDAKILYLVDASTWANGDLPNWGDIASASLVVSYKTPDILDGTIDYVKDISNVFIAASSQSDLVYTVTSTDLQLGGDVALPDGIYSINYIVSNGTQTWQFDSKLELLLDAQIKFEVYKRVATIPAKYICSNNYYTKPIDDNLLIQSLYDSLQANAYVAKQDGILAILDTLQRQTA